MARRSTNLIIGLFVIVGGLLGVAAIIWVGATSYFQKGETYVSYFDESVQGLQMDSAVKFRGVEVGRVEAIRVAPDNRLIGVVMKVNMQGDLQKTAVAQLKAAGITGVMFVELSLRKPGEEEFSPKIDFPAEYPIIPSRPSEIQQIVAGFNEIMKKLNQIDTKGISDHLIATTQALENFLQGKQMTSILTRLDSTTGNLEQLTARLNEKFSGHEMETMISEVRETLKGARTLVNNVNQQFMAMQLPATLAQTRDITRTLQATSDNLRQSSEILEKFFKRVYDRPSDLLFGKPPQKRWNE
jgi:phospholipid/cholesterol/gamma-HCH transport system substrate-binding protein